MTTIVRIISALIVFSGLALAQGQEANAALRYWMAFAQMENPEVTAGIAELMERVAKGEAEWDERQLAPIVSANLAALQTMHRGSRLKTCRWGLEMDLGPEAPIAHIARGRALGRLNLLLAARQLAKDEPQQAFETLLAGMRFARHLAEDGSLISALAGRSLLVAHIQRLTALQDPKLRQQAREAVAAVPEYGFDWSAAYRREHDAALIALQQLQRSPKRYQAWFGADAGPPPEVRTPDIHAVGSHMAAASHILRQPAEVAAPRLRSLEMQELGPWQKLVPSPSRVNEARISFEQQRRQVLEELGK